MFSVVRVSPVARAGCSRALATVASSSSPVLDKKNLRKPGGKDIVLIDGVRTPFLVSGTKYKDVMLHDLAKDAFRGVVRRTGIDKNQVEYIAFGSVVQDVQTANVAREAALAAGFPENIPAHTCTMACISSNQAVTTCIGGLLTGTFNVAIAGGGDFLSDIPIRLSKTMRQILFSLKKTKNRLEQLSLVSKLLWPSAWKPDLPSLSEFSSGETMGHYGDRLASAFRVTRAEQDEYGMRSHKLARKASDEGLLSDIIPVKVPGYSDYIERDNGIRPATPEVMAKLKPAFIRPHGTVTAGTSSFLTDGASACLLTTSEHAKKIGLSAKAYLRDFVYVSQDPVDQLLLGPSYAIPRLLQRNGLTLADIDVFEIHEAFAGQVLANLKALDCDFFCKEYLGLSKPLGAIPIEKLNTWGGSNELTIPEQTDPDTGGEGEWIRARPPRRHRRVKAGKLQHVLRCSASQRPGDRPPSGLSDLVDDDDIDTMRQKYSAIRYHFQNSVTGGRFLDMLLGEIREAFDSIAPSGIGSSSVDVLCLGLGNPAVDRTSLRQLALLELLIERDTRLSRAHTKLYDPVFRSVSRRFIRELGMQVITVNAEACYSLSPDRYHFVMMPHCAPALINNLLSTNWCEKVLGRIVLFSNGWRQVRSELTASGEPEDLIATELGCICALEPIVAVADRQGKKGTTKYIEEPDFEGMRVQWFPPTSLMRLSADFWSIPAAAPTLGTKSSKFVGLGPLVTPNSHFSADLIDRNTVPCFVDGEKEFESEGYP